MAFLTYDDAKRFASGIMEEGLQKSASVTPDGADVFLSHSSLDWKILRGIRRLLIGHHAKKIYVDKEDGDLPAITSAKTAYQLADQISGARRTVLVITPNTAKSLWVPWELGLAHGIKGQPYIALLPIAQSDAEAPWARQEYLGLYPVIRWSTNPRQWQVVDPADGKYWTLRDWMTAEELQAAA